VSDVHAWSQVGRDVVRHLVHGDLADRAPGGGRLECGRAAGGHAVEVGGTAHCGDQRVDVLDLATDVVVRGVVAGAAAPAVVVHHGEALGQGRHEGTVLAAVGETTADENHCRTVPGALIGDGSAVLRGSRELRHPLFLRSVTVRGA
jgi:hypothetical protein